MKSNDSTSSAEVKSKRTQIRANPCRIVLCGTDTEIGKTHVGTRIARELVAQGLRVGAFKPFESGWAGERSDAARWMRATESRQSLNTICPWRLERPVTPADELARIGLRVTAADLREAARVATPDDADVFMIESAGGVASPLTDRLVSADLGPILDAHTLLIASDQLGTISTTVSSVALLRSRGVEPVAIVYNDRSKVRQASQRRWIAELTGVPVVAFENERANEAASTLVELARTSELAR